MTRRTLVALATIFAMILPVGPAGARNAEPDQATPPAVAHADLDGNGLSRAVESRLEAAGADEQLEVIVTWDRRPDVAAARAAAGPFEILQEFSIIDGFLARARPAQVRALANMPGVFRIDTNFEVLATNEETDVDYGTEQARLDFGVDGTGINVCVLDTGADPNHEQLDSQILGFFDAINGLTTVYDDQGHGTHVAATIAGDGVGSSPNAARYQGIAPGAGLYIAKVLNSAGSGSTAQIINGIDWCVLQPGVRVMSMSLGTASGSDGLDPLSQAVNNAVLLHDIVNTVAAGNSGDGPESVGSPGAAAEALTVGASSKFDAGLHLAPFSSRGPNMAGVLKPEIVSPGVAVVSADAGTTAGYFAASGTSMATPFTAGAVALALQADPLLTAEGVKSLVTSTARDVGDPGPDNNWGHGLIDGYGLVSAASGGSASSSLPAHSLVSGSVPNNGLWSHPIPITGDDVGQPLGITVLINGRMECSLSLFGICLIWEWSPDLDARLIAPDGSITNSRCALEGDCGSTGVQETYHVSSALQGTYVLEIYPFDGNPNNGQGGSFDIDIFTGAAGSTTPPANQVPDAVDDGYSTAEDTPLSMAAPGLLLNDTDPDGDTLTVTANTQPANGTATVNTDGSFDYTPNPDFFGTDTFTYTASDGNGGSDTAIVTITVTDVNDPPVADAGPDQTVTDSDGNGSETVTLDGSGSTDVDGTLTYSWSEGGSEIATGVNPPVTLAVGLHTITLTVTDDDGDTDTDTVVIDIEAAPLPDTMHVGDLDGSSVNLRRGRWTATATATVHDAFDNPIEGATVTFSLSTGGTDSCVTDGSGQCAVTSPEVRKRIDSVVFTVTGISGALTYDAGANHDPDGDSDGTTITVLKS